MTTTALAAADLVSRAEELGPQLAEDAAAAEAGATLPRRSVDALSQAGLFRMGLPRVLGGWEADPRTFVRVVETLSCADGSAGWTTLIGNSSAFFAWLEPEVAAEMVGADPDQVSTSVFAPTGAGEPEDDGYRVSGTWTMNTGAPHASWFCQSFVVTDDGVPRMRDGEPVVRSGFYPSGQGTVHRTWEGAMGLRGTGSHDVVADGVHVPGSRTFDALQEPARFGGPLYRLSFVSLLRVMLMGFPLGVGRHVLDEFARVARTRYRGLPPVRLADSEDVHTQLALAEAGLRSARAYAYDVLARLWDEARGENGVSRPVQLELDMALHQAMRSALAAADTAYTLAGASANRAGDPLQRAWRDLHTGACHVMFSNAELRRAARGLLGVAHAGDDTFL